MLHLVVGDGMHELWVAVSGRDTAGNNVPVRHRDMVFISLEATLDGPEFEHRADWPTGRVLDWWETVRLYVFAAAV